MGNSNRILWILIGALLLLNLATLGSFWWSSNSTPSHPHKEYRKSGHIFEEIGWDSSQEKAFEEARDRHHMAMRSYIDEQLEIRKELFALIGSEENPKVAALTQKLGKVRERFERVTFEHFREVRAICKEDQIEQFDSLVQNLGPMLGSQRRPRRGNGSHHPPGDGMGPPHPPHPNRSEH